MRIAGDNEKLQKFAAEVKEFEERGLHPKNSGESLRLGVPSDTDGGVSR